jgi:hypothetical protein
VNEDTEELESLLMDPRHEQEWIRQNNLIYGGLIGVGVVMVQPFLATPSPELPARVCVVAFSVAIPLLAALVLLNEQEAFERHAIRSRLTNVAKAVSQALAFVGVVAGFWHIWWIAGLGVVISGAVGVAVHSAGFMGLVRAGSGRPGRDS